MIKRLAIFLILTLSLLISSQEVKPNDVSNNVVAHGVVIDEWSPEPHRDESVRKWLNPSLRLHNKGAYGSGTICYYDSDKNIAYIISCAHLIQSKNDKIDIDVYYKNGTKLEKPQKFQGQVIAVQFGNPSKDISIITFAPDWKPTFAPIASEYEYKKDEMLHSTGCDGASETACYFIKVMQLETEFLVTHENSPRPGRSGGGLMTDDMKFVGICVRTSDTSGNGSGFYIHLASIHEFCKANSLEFLLNADNFQKLRKIKIIDKDGQQQVFPKDYIPVP